jgi:steroid delta-isomerase-like uncharacterized protein
VWNEGNLSVIYELVAPGCVDHDPASPEEARGPERARQFVEMYRSAFSDAQLTVEDQIAEGDKVVTRWTSRGTHQGELVGIPPSGNRAEVSGISRDSIEGGKFVETWDNYDALDMMQQIGAVSLLEQQEVGRAEEDQEEKGLIDKDNLTGRLQRRKRRGGRDPRVRGSGPP